MRQEKNKLSKEIDRLSSKVLFHLGDANFKIEDQKKRASLLLKIAENLEMMKGKLANGVGVDKINDEVSQLNLEFS